MEWWYTRKERRKIKQSTVTVSGFYLLCIPRALAVVAQKPTLNQIMCVSLCVCLCVRRFCETSDLDAHIKEAKKFVSSKSRTKTKVLFQWNVHFIKAPYSNSFHHLYISLALGCFFLSLSFSFTSSLFLFKGSATIVANMLIIEPNKFTQCAHILSRISFSCVHETC